MTGVEQGTTARHLRGLVAARTVADREGISVESVDLEAAADAPLVAADVTGRVEAALAPAIERMPVDEVGDPREFRRALDILLAETRRATDKLDSDPDTPLTPDDAMTMEAVVRTDGTRPSLLVRDGSVDPNHPLAGDWATTFAETREQLRPHVGAVGRIEPANPTARNYFGTGWVVDADKGLVLTNLHVLRAIWNRLSQRMQRVGNGFRVLDGVFVDFIGESGATATNRFKVVEATPSGVDGPDYARLDAAVLRIEPTPEGQADPPSAIRVVADLDGPRGNLASACVVGFPGPPPFTGGMQEGVDWAWVNRTLFGNRFGVKRLAPGITHRPLGAFVGDPRHWVFGHDMTTLGGSSGSPILNWLGGDPAAFGLHFAGASVETNVAHAIAECAAELNAMGVPVVMPGDL
jgi:hypothetical protein